MPDLRSQLTSLFKQACRASCHSSTRCKTSSMINYTKNARQWLLWSLRSKLYSSSLKTRLSITCPSLAIISPNPSESRTTHRMKHKSKAGTLSITVRRALTFQDSKAHFPRRRCHGVYLRITCASGPVIMGRRLLKMRTSMTSSILQASRFA